jgi:hypothetical protein
MALMLNSQKLRVMSRNAKEKAVNVNCNLDSASMTKTNWSLMRNLGLISMKKPFRDLMRNLNFSTSYCCLGTKILCFPLCTRTNCST